MAMASAVILFFYLLIGLSDSIHFHPELENVNHQETIYSTKVLSVLDVAITHLRVRDEKTYSAPFATHAYSKETIELADGSTTREYPRLDYGGAYLLDPEHERMIDIALKSLAGLFYGLIIWCFVSVVIIFTVKCRKNSSFKDIFHSMLKQSDVPWKVIHLTLGAVLVVLTVSLTLSNYYHILGTDKIGQDVFYQALKSVRTGLVIGTLTTLVMLPFAILMGLMAGYFRGWVDDVIQYLYTTLSSIPGVLLIPARLKSLQYASHSVINAAVSW